MSATNNRRILIFNLVCAAMLALDCWIGRLTLTWLYVPVTIVLIGAAVFKRQTKSSLKLGINAAVWIAIAALAVVVSNKTTSRALTTIRAAAENYKGQYHVWPKSLLELKVQGLELDKNGHARCGTSTILINNDKIIYSTLVGEWVSVSLNTNKSLTTEAW